MNAKQIIKALPGVQVYPIDLLPNVKRPGAYVVNTDEHDKPGKHWVAIYVTRRRTEYFDSYGLPPQDKRLVEFMGDYYYNTRMLQGPFSTFCGHYCIYFLSKRVNGSSANKIIASFPNLADQVIKNRVFF